MTPLTTAPQEPPLLPVGLPSANFPVAPPAIEQTPIHTPSPPNLSEGAPSTSNNRRSSSTQVQMQYRVIPPMSPRTKAMLPPRILTAAEWVSNFRCCQVRILTYEQCRTEGREGASPFVFVDAQAVETPGQKGTTQEDKDMAAFLPMLQEYLRCACCSLQVLHENANVIYIFI